MGAEDQTTKDEKKTDDLLRAIAEVNNNILTSINKAAQNETTLVRIEEQLKSSIAIQKQMSESLAELNADHGKLKLDFHSQPDPYQMKSEIDAMKISEARREGKMSIIIQLMWAGIIGVFGLVYLILKAIGLSGLKALTGD